MKNIGNRIAAAVLLVALPAANVAAQGASKGAAPSPAAADFPLAPLPPKAAAPSPAAADFPLAPLPPKGATPSPAVADFPLAKLPPNAGPSPAQVNEHGLANLKASPKLAGDDKLTCPQIFAEAQMRGKEFDALLQQADNTTPEMSARTKALLVATEVGSIAAVAANPLGNDAAGAAVAATSQAYMESGWADTKKAMEPIEDRIDFAEARQNYLNDLYRTKCFKKKGTTTAAASGPLSGNAPAPAATPAPATPPAPTPQAPVVTAAAPPVAPGTGGAAQCVALKAEALQLRGQMNASVAAAMSIAQNANPAKRGVASSAASTVANVATSLVPTPLGGLVSDAAAAAKAAAQKAQRAAFEAKVNGVSQDLGTISQRLALVEYNYEEQCGGPLPQ